MKPYDLSQGLPPLDEVLKAYTSSAQSNPQIKKSLLERVKTVFGEPNEDSQHVASPLTFSDKIALVSLDAKVNDVVYAINPKARPFDAFVEYNFWYGGDGWSDFRDSVVPAVNAIDAEYPKIEIAFLALTGITTLSAVINKYLPNIIHKRVLQVTNPPSAMVKNIIARSCDLRRY